MNWPEQRGLQQTEMEAEREKSHHKDYCAWWKDSNLHPKQVDSSLRLMIQVWEFLSHMVEVNNMASIYSMLLNMLFPLYGTLSWSISMAAPHCHQSSMVHTNEN